MRGIRAHHAQHHSRRGISPAHAGNTTTLPQSGRPVRGSAPHMRGIRRRVCIPAPRGGISPAHAGNTSQIRSQRSVGGDQPRTCGEYMPFWAGGRSQRGSAPHMRGILLGGGHRGAPGPDQPRTCGEYHLDLRHIVVGGGSAPHMRGIPGPGRRRMPDRRISPAHAGNTWFLS